MNLFYGIAIGAFDLSLVPIPYMILHFKIWVGDCHMKQTGMLIVSLRGVNFGFWSRLGCCGHSTNILSRKETQNYAKRNNSNFLFNLFFCICVFLSGLFQGSKSA